MIKNLYILAIGGSGEHILKPFLLSLAAGMPINAECVIPVFLDNDADGRNAELKECKELITNYRKLREYFVNNCNNVPVPKIAKIKLAEPIYLNVNGGNIQTLGQILKHPTLTASLTDREKELNASLFTERDLLFNTQDLSLNLNVGFVGNPNIGSVVLNSQCLILEQFNVILEASEDDAVLVLGSLFGGTGAAGIPLIINKLNRDAAEHKPYLGCIAMTPYFNVAEQTNDEDADELGVDQSYKIVSSTFEPKTRAALMYYDQYMCNLDSMYYVGDSKRPTYKNKRGQQHNPTHLCEFIAAMGIYDFARHVTHVEDSSEIAYLLPKWGFIKSSDCRRSNIDCVIEKDAWEALVRFSIMQQMFLQEDILRKDIRDQIPYVRDFAITEEIIESVIGARRSYAWAKPLSDIFKSWDNWRIQLSEGWLENINLPHRTEPQRPFSWIKSGNVSANEVLTLFYSTRNGEGYGLAQTETIHHIFREDETKVKSAMLRNRLNAAYSSLNLTNKNNYTNEQKLAILLSVISSMLDSMINEII